MKKRIFRIISLLLLIAVLIGAKEGLSLGQTTVRAVGDLSVDWGVPEGDPIFVISGFAPGNEVVRQVTVVNNASTIRPVGVRGIMTSETGGLSEKLLLEVLIDGAVVYGPVTLSQFFADSSGPDGIPLMNINPGDDKLVTFKVTFDPGSGNEYQDNSVVFDLRIGIAVEIPQECLGMVFSGDPIFGTEGNDNIRGTNGSDLIYAFEGDDTVKSGNGNDCVIGGPGNDRINNSNGDDIIYGNEGDDELKGSNGHDKIFGGPGNDRIYGSNGNDYLEGNEGDDFLDGSNGDDIIDGGQGNDKIIGSNGNDLINGNEGNDDIDGGNGSDEIYGGPGDDVIKGGNNNDFLDGGEGNDNISGNLGKDTCLGEIKDSCEL